METFLAALIADFVVLGAIASTAYGYKLRMSRKITKQIRSLSESTGFDFEAIIKGDR